MRPLNVVIVAPQLPSPTAGNRIRTLKLALELARRHKITFIAHRNAEADEAIKFLGMNGIQTILANQTILSKSGPCFYLRLIGNLGSRLPYSVAAHNSEALRAAVKALSKRQQVDLWQVEGTPLINVLEYLDSVPKVLIAHNVESLIWRRSYVTERNLFKRWYIKKQWKKFENFERAAFEAATRVVSVSNEEARLVRDVFGARAVDVVDNGIDRQYFEPVRADRDPKEILFLGVLDWHPNLDAVALLLDRIFPQVRQKEPSARLRLVGRKPPAALVRRIRGLSGVEINSDVPDVRPYLARSAVMAVPLRIGGGSRLKILEALATGLPVISTRVGAEGLELVPGQDYITADEPESFSRELVACLRDPTRALAMAERARRFVLERYDWKVLANRLESIWVKCATPQAAASQETHLR